MCSQWLTAGLSFPMDFLPKLSFLPTAPPNSFLGLFCYPRTMAGQVEAPWCLVIPCCHVPRFSGFCCFHRFKKYFTFGGVIYEHRVYITSLLLIPPTPPGLCPPTRCFPSSWSHILNSVFKNRFQNLAWSALWVLQSDSIGTFSATNLCNGGVTVSSRTEWGLNLRSTVRLSLGPAPKSLSSQLFKWLLLFFLLTTEPCVQVELFGLCLPGLSPFSTSSQFSFCCLLDFRSSYLCFSLEWSLFPPSYSNASLSLHMCFPYLVDWAWRRSDPCWRTGRLIRSIHRCNAQSRDKSAFPVWNNNPSIWREHSK